VYGVTSNSGNPDISRVISSVSGLSIWALIVSESIGSYLENIGSCVKNIGSYVKELTKEPMFSDTTSPNIL